ncbi:hypothetical protein Q5425_35770 [Amycolatopsis sp. A133]|uniref:hypothetical protein n=1 Tax=Amycolatopsis sp. A133 TaxID=3064472 RepID=UPI0027ED3D8A|nr:hypothetical protein [Amycolatopsis sp. A133]MDQ7809115.1 hypothetical protein [Amycolatopsis sp. A133]
MNFSGRRAFRSSDRARDHFQPAIDLRVALAMLQKGAGSGYAADAMSMLAIAPQHTGERGEATFSSEPDL